MNMQVVQDKAEIVELMYRYARAIDTKDWALLNSVFTEDAHLDYSSVGYPPGPRDEVIALLRDALTQVPLTQHFVTNIEIDLDGATAKVRAMFFNPMQLPGVSGMTYCGATTTTKWCVLRMAGEAPDSGKRVFGSRIIPDRAALTRPLGHSRCQSWTRRGADPSARIIAPASRVSSRALPRRPSSTSARRMCRCRSCSAVKPIPPSTCWQ